MRSINYCPACSQQIAAHYGKDFRLPLPCYVCGEIIREPVGSVVAVIVPLNGPTPRVILVERTDPETLGQLALPGGHQQAGETWQAAGAREVFEETGVQIDPRRLILNSIHTIEKTKAEGDRTGQTINLILAESEPVDQPEVFSPGMNETSRVVPVGAPVELAFPLHTTALMLFFNKNRDVS